MKDRVQIFEMSPRDGLQNEPRQIETQDKIKLVDLLSETGLTKIETASFVNPKAVPQMADSAKVMAGIRRKSGIHYTALTPNMRGFEASRLANADEIAIFASASEGFSQANIRCSVAESIERFIPILKAAKAVNLPVRGYVSCIADCPYDGPTPPLQVADLAKTLLRLGCYEVSLGDTIGSGSPERTQNMLKTVLEHVPVERLAGHFHDTKGFALENIKVSLSEGIRTFDASVGGLGGCPFAPGAAGNVATEAVVSTVEQLGHATGVDQAKLEDAAEFAKSLRA